MQRNSPDVVKRFGKIILKGIAPPACSRLYSIEPVGVGTPMIESMTSYVSRLALAHCVTVGTLVAKEIAPLIDKDYLTDKSSLSMSTQFSRSARAMNGIGITAADWVNTLQRLTHLQELPFLTMLHLKGLISNKKLLRKFRAWCPNCYEGWHQDRKPVYDPLSWSIGILMVCPTHKQALRNKCAHCNKQSPALPRNLRPGFCSNCNLWLGSADIAPVEGGMLVDDQLDWQSWLGKQLGDVLAVATELPSPLQNGVATSIVSLCIQRLTRGDIKALVRRFDSFSYGGVLNWQRGQALPEIGRLMRLCFHAGVSIPDILLKRELLHELLKKTPPVRTNVSKRVTTAELKGMKSSLRSMVEEDPPPSIHEVGKRLGCHYITVKHHFPGPYNIIKERYSTFTAGRFDKKRIKSSLAAAKKELPPPSLNSIAKSFGCSRNFLRNNFPEASRAVRDRFAEYRRVFAAPDEVLIRLQALQSAFPPLSIIQCAEQLGCTRDNLSRYFPEVTHAIGNRYSKYQSREAKLRRQKRQSIIREAATALEVERITPNSYQIRKRLKNIESLTNLEIDAVLHGELTRLKKPHK